MSAAPGCHSDHCITCGDDGVPMVVLSADAGDGLALCEQEDGRRVAVDTALVAPAPAGSVVLVHAGVAIASLAHTGEEALR